MTRRDIGNARRIEFNSLPGTPKLRTDYTTIRLPTLEPSISGDCERERAAQLFDRARLIGLNYSAVPCKYPKRCGSMPGGAEGIRFSVKGVVILFGAFQAGSRMDIVQLARLSDATAYYFRDARSAREFNGYNLMEDLAKTDSEFGPLKSVLERYRASFNEVGILGTKGAREATTIIKENQRMKILEDCLNKQDSELLTLKRELCTACARIQTLEQHCGFGGGGGIKVTPITEMGPLQSVLQTKF